MALPGATIDVNAELSRACERRADSDADYVGAIFGKSVELAPGASLVGVGFQAWDRVDRQNVEPLGPRPVLTPVPRTLHAPPPLNATGTAAQAQAHAFVDWAAGSVLAEEQDVRNALDGARNNADIVRAFAIEVVNGRREDRSRAVVALSLLGSMRSIVAQQFLIDFVRLPLPTEGFVGSHGGLSENEPVEATSLAMLQTLAVDGLGLIGTSTANQEVVRVAAEHPSRIVRAEAIRATIASRGAAGRSELESRVRAEDRYLLDRFENRNTDGSTFDERLRTYLAAHPSPAPTPDP